MSEINASKSAINVDENRTDVLTTEQRSYCMSQIKGRNTGPELRLRKALWSSGLRYRLKNKLPGKPDLVFVSSKIAVFVDGCFWHGCSIHANTPKTNSKFWKEKIRKNINRDKQINDKLNEMGWKVLRFWEHEVDEDTERIIKIMQIVVKGRR